jgi:hypothetical protein
VNLRDRVLRKGFRLLARVGLAPPPDPRAVMLDYPPSYRAEPRWQSEPLGFHPELKRLFDARAASFEAVFDRILERGEDLRQIPTRPDPERPDVPHWVNGWFPALDAAALYTLVADHRPARFVEVGSGQSTRFVRHAIGRHSPGTRLSSVDPQPRAEIDRLCDESIRRSFEEIPLSFFDDLGPGDFLFIDGSHRSFMNSDVTVFFLDVLPRLRAGVFVHLHDIYLPADYPRTVGATDLYNEQYLLAAFLLGGGKGVEIVLPNCWASNVAEMQSRREALWDALAFAWRTGEFPRDHLGGGSFWMRTTGR